MDPIITVLYSNWCVTIRYKNLSASCTFSVINGGQVSVNNTEIIRIIEELMGGKRPIQEIGKERWVSDNRKRPSGPEIDSIDTIRTTLSFFLWFPWKWVLYNPYTERLEVVRDGRSNELMNSTEITAKREATVICGRLSFRLASATSSSRPPKINEGGHRIAEDRDDSLMNTSRLREVRLFKPSIFAPSSLLRWSNPGHQSRQTLTTFSPAFRHTDRSISDLLAKGKLITRLVTHALHSNFSLMLENLYPKVFYTSGIFLCDRMDLSLIFTFPHFRLFLTLALIFDTYRSIQRYTYIIS